MSPLAVSPFTLAPVTPAQAFKSAILLDPTQRAADPFAANVWSGTGLITSLGQPQLSQVVSLPALPQGAKGLDGRWVSIVGREKPNGNFLRNPFRDTASVVTGDVFAQVQVYYALTSFIMYCNDQLGFDMAKVLAKRLPIVCNVNTSDALNAWFDPGAGNLTFGTSLESGREWHLGSDHKIPWHEGWHLILDCIVPALISWYSGDGGKIHEGTADAAAAFFSLDDDMSEDFPPNIGELYGPDRGLRTVENTLTYNEAGDEVHDGGRVFGGLTWGAKAGIEKPLKTPRIAADLSLALLLNFGAHLATNSPGPADFVDALVAGAKAYLGASGKFDIPFETVKRVITVEAQKREMLDPERPAIGVRKRDYRELAYLLADSKFSFRELPPELTRGTFGARDSFQQHLFIAGQAVRLLGSGLIVFRGPNEEFVAFSDADVNKIPNVNPTMNINREQALSKATAAITKLLRQLEREIDKLSGGRAASRKDELGKAKAVNRAKRKKHAMESTYKVVTGLSSADAELVVLPRGFNGGKTPQELHWYFAGGKVGPEALGRVIVNAVTGEVRFAIMPPL